MKKAVLSGGISAVVVALLIPLSVLGQQRVQFPSAIPASPPGNIPTNTAPGILPNGSYGTPAYSPAPTYGQPPAYGPGMTTGPSAAFQGNVQAPPSTWDPYCSPGSEPTTILPYDPTIQGIPSIQSFPDYCTQQVGTMQKFVQGVNLNYFWMPGSGSEELGLHDADLSSTFAIPFFFNPETPLLVTPGFALQLWNGPSGGSYDLPPRTYEAYLNAAWAPRLNEVVSGELGARVGVYSDFGKITNQSIRYQGSGLAVISVSRSLQVKAGAVYLDRVKIKLLPAGGVVWTPNADIRFEILFPYPKLAWRLPTYGGADWWFYVRGEYGGDSWTVKRTDPLKGVEQVDYNDIRVAVGFDFDSVEHLDGYVEVGFAFQRELIYRDWPGDNFEPNATVFAGAGLLW